MPRNERLHQHRIQRNWRQQDVADQLQISLVTVQRWERGTHQPSLYYRVKLCELFGLSAQELGLVEETLSPLKSESAEVVAANSVPVALWNVPYRRNPHFTGRDDLLTLLEERFALSEASQPESIRRMALGQAQAIKGLGGIGKTQIAVEYAYRAREQGRYVHTLWVPAASEEAILSSFAALADQLPARGAQDETDQRKLAAAVIEWLEQCEQPWLLIFDNADELSLLTPYLPQRGNVLLTTQASAAGSFASTIEVDAMSLMEGTRFLLRRAQRLDTASEEEVNEAGNIVVALAQFPLALDQAGAYIEESGCSLRDYLHLYQQHRSAFLARRGIQATQYPESVATTWSLSFQRIEQVNPAAAELLRLCAFLAPDHIPEELLFSGAPYWSPMLQHVVADRLAFNQMLEALLRFSLVKRLAEDHLLSIHRLVQVVQMEMMEHEEQRRWVERVVCALNVIFPRDPREHIAVWPLCQRYLEQAQACALLIQHYHLQLPEAAELLDRVGIYLSERALYSVAEFLFREALHVWEQQAQPDHARIASSLGNLGDIYRERGEYREAESLYQLAISLYEQFVGQADDQAAHLFQRLAIIFLRQGKYAEAEPLYQRALSVWEQQLGPEHPYVANVLTNLANLYSRQEKYRQAVALHLRALRIREQQLGQMHPQLAASLHGLAYAYHRQGRYAQAEPLYQRALQLREQQLGERHPDLFDPLNDLAHLFLQQERYEQAKMYYQRALSILEKQVGPEQTHPDMVSSLHGLARVYAAQRKQKEAFRFFQRALRICKQQMAPEHLVTGEVLRDFADFQQSQDRPIEAARLYQRALLIQEHALGPDHPSTNETRKRLRALLLELGRTEEAIALDALHPALKKKR